MKKFCYIVIVSLTGWFGSTGAFGKETVDILIVGGGASGTTAGIQASRMGIRTLIIEKTTWLGGMLTAAGVSAIDGNHQMPSGLWGEFRNRLYDYYGGSEAVETGWVSHTLFEPGIGNQILKEMADHENLNIWYQSIFKSIDRKDDFWKVEVMKDGKRKVVYARILIDATELGDVLAKAGVAYSLGMDSRKHTGEMFAPLSGNNIIQDMTYVAILKDYGPEVDKTIPQPEGYNATEFSCACDISDPASNEGANNYCLQMIQYGRLPNNKYMINWPKCGNDIYLNIIEKTEIERADLLEKAKQQTLRFVYFLQTELGFSSLGLTTDEFPTPDHLPMIPYHREARRMHGKVTLTLPHLTEPYKQKSPLYRTGITVGDYPIDHHHLKNPEAPAIDFVKIKVPSYNIPLGALIPEAVKGLIVAEKSISVSNIVNGTTRLQPVVLGIGQAAGALAAICIKENVPPAEVSIRQVQQVLLDAEAYIMPFIDVKPKDSHFKTIQRVGATGILKGTGIPYKWANQTWFYPESTMSEYDLFSGLRDFYPWLTNNWSASGEVLTACRLISILKRIDPTLQASQLKNDWETLGFRMWNENMILTRRMIAVIIDHYLDPFSQAVDINGNVKKFINQTKK